MQMACVRFCGCGWVLPLEFSCSVRLQEVMCGRCGQVSMELYLHKWILDCYEQELLISACTTMAARMAMVS